MAKRKKPDDLNQENLDSSNDADNFGLPDIEYKPLDEPKQEETPAQEENNPFSERQEEAAPSYEAPKPEPTFEKPAYKSPYTYANEEEAQKSNAPVIIAVIIGLVVVVAGFLIYQYVIKPQQEKERQEQLAKQQEEARKLKEEQERKAREAEEERKRREAEAAANATPKEGTIETLSERTQRYYVVVVSAIDADLIMDHAKKLSAQGVSTKIIPPFGKHKFSRLAIADHDTYANAQANADAVKGNYGNEVWVIKY